MKEVATLTSPEFGELSATGKLVVLLPVGSVEPHGPHMMLATDTVISTGAIRRANDRLVEAGFIPLLAPAIPYGVTECAAQFPGVVTVPAAELTSFVAAVVDGYLGQGAVHVCVVNNHLEPAQDAAIRASIANAKPGTASVACPLTRRWARLLSAEFKSGACHAGRYETSLVLAECADGVDDERRVALEENPVSLAAALTAGVTDFVEMGLTEAYAGAPALASANEGEEQFAVLAEMIATTVIESLEKREP